MDLKKQEVYYFYGAFITTFMAVILGVVTKNYNILLFSVLGAFSFSFVSFSNQKKDIKNVFLHGLTMLIAFNLGTLVSLSLMILPFLAAFVFFISYLYCEMFKIGAPRYFYILVLFSSGVKVSGTSLTLDSLLVANISILSGVLFSIMYILFVFNIVLKLTKQTTIDTNNLLKISTGFSDSWKQPEIIQKAVYGAFTFFILGYIIYLLNGGDSVWINDHIVNFGGNKNKLFLIGDSAGGNLVLGLVHKNQNIQKFDIKGQILMYPDTSFEYTTHSINENSLFHFPTKEILYTVRKAYLNNEYEIYNTLVSPLLANVSNIPPTLVITAENNPLRDEAILYHEKLLHENRDSTHFNFKDMEHGFIQYYQHPRNSQAAENALSEIKRWVSNKISNEIV